MKDKIIYVDFILKRKRITSFNNYILQRFFYLLLNVKDYIKPKKIKEDKTIVYKFRKIL